MARHIILIGMPGAGKTAAAPHAARALGCEWDDLDSVIAADSKLDISAIFDRHGEAVFRDLERNAMARLLRCPPRVIAAGGGWAVQPGNLDQASPLALIIYLSVAADTAMRRLREAEPRPLLGGAEAATRWQELLRAREDWYRLADVEIASGIASAEVVGDGIAAAARQYGGWNA